MSNLLLSIESWLRPKKTSRQLVRHRDQLAKSSLNSSVISRRIRNCPERVVIIGSVLLVALLGACVGLSQERSQGWIAISKEGNHFVDSLTQRPFVASGFNYDHDENGRLIEDYWENEWTKVVEDFHEMKSLGARVVRVHLQFGKFMEAADRPNLNSMRLLKKLSQEASRLGLYLNLTGLGCYHKKDVPPWYDALSEEDRWQAQAQFWVSIAKEVQNEPSIFCFDLMNEPVVPGGRRESGDWLGPAFAGKHFVQMIALDPKGRSRESIAKGWIDHLVREIRRVDQRHLITVGMVDWSLDRPGLTSGFVPHKVADSLDFLSVHIYPDSKELQKADETLQGFQLGKPVVVEETFPLRCTSQELLQWIEASKDRSQGWISFYWGQDLESLGRSKELKDAILKSWLEVFRP